MYKQKTGYKKAMRNGVAMLLTYIFLFAITICVGIFLKMGFLYVLSVISAFMIFWTIKQIKKIERNYIEISKNTAIAKETIAKCQETLNENAFVVSKHISAFGYSFIEYRNDFSAPDNIHLWIDEENKRLAFAELLANHFKIFNYSEIVSADLLKKAQQVGTREIVTALVVVFVLQDDEFAYGIPVNDNQGFYTDTEEYDKFMEQAETLLTLLRSFMCDA